MSAPVDRARPLYLAASAAVLLATSLGAGRVLTVQNAGSNVAFEENPVAGVTVPTTPVPTTSAPAEHVGAVAPVGGRTTTTTAAGAVPTTSPIPLCQWTVHMIAGGLEGFGAYGDADQFIVTVRNAAWAGEVVYYHVNYAAPAVARPVLVSLPQQAVADSTGTATFVLPIGPESQGGAIALLASPRQRILDALAANDVCDWNEFAVDYNGPTGLPGGINASLAKNLSGVVGLLGS